jgi:hypothetical protein
MKINNMRELKLSRKMTLLQGARSGTPTHQQETPTEIAK